MFPFSFEEFMLAMGETIITETYRKATPQQPLSEPVHDKLIRRMKTFLVIGGMPEVVAEYVKSKDLLKCQKVLKDILDSLKGDFGKYRKRIPALRIAEVFNSVVHQAKEKFVYERAAVQVTNAQVKQALDLLMMAGLVYPITHTAANGIPLGGEINLKFQRFTLFDTGLFLLSLDLDISEILITNDFQTVNKGALAEIFVGLELMKASSCYNPIALYYWQKKKSEGQAQVDFLIQRRGEILPIEVKSGTQGAMQSMRVFMAEKNIKQGIRTSLENFSQYEDIEVYPMYAISNLYR
jgi:predicted AAA+ superfamily ATPase